MDTEDAMARDMQAQTHGLKMPFNDIDVYHGHFGDGDFLMTQHQDKKLGLTQDVQFVRCTELSMEYFSRSCDINIVKVATHVEVADGKVVSVHWQVSPEFWDFIFNERALKHLTTKTPSQTGVRLAYKAWQTGLPFWLGDGLDILQGEFFPGHHKKYEEMKLWERNPFAAYEAIPVEGKSNTWQFIKPSKSIKCTICGKKANQKCNAASGPLCAKCCQAKAPCRVTTHNKKPPPGEPPLPPGEAPLPS